jgi:hypothetical protein
MLCDICIKKMYVTQMTRVHYTHIAGKKSYSLHPQL